MKAPSEEPARFEDSIELNTPMTAAEAVEKLALFHDTSPEVVFLMFRDLKGFEGTVEFQEGANGATPCITMSGKNLDGKYAWNTYIRKSTGQPMTHVS